jgi:ATP-binding cassette subfamily C (CFTR/MRP) protein 1
VRHDGSILSAQAFTSLALISLLTNPLLIICQVMPAIWQAVACFGRIETYCAKDSRATLISLSSKPEEFHASLVSFQNANIAWSSDQEPVLPNLKLTIHQGITMIVGPVGSGKSTLLESIVNQHMVKTGSMTTSFSRAAYCPQIPWIRNDTVRGNIIGFHAFDQAWYDFTCAVCGLQDDLGSFAKGDMHMTGSDGIALSGGQKQRIVSYHRC